MEKVFEKQSTMEYVKLTSFIVIVILGFGIGFGGSVQAADEYNPTIVPADFSTTITNKYFTLTPGTTFSYTSKTEEGTETGRVVITNLVREVMGVKTLVVWDRAWLNNELIEETYDSYAQHKNGDVWYFGEGVRNFEHGVIKGNEGSWEAGIDGAKPGIIMKADPKVGEMYYQEYYRGQAEDEGKVLAVGETAKTPYGTFQDCLKTHDSTRLEPELQEDKYFCPKIGMLALDINTATGQKEELVDIQQQADFVGLPTATNEVKNSGEGEREDKEEERPWIAGAGIGGLLLGVGLGKFLRMKKKVA